MQKVTLDSIQLELLRGLVWIDTETKISKEGIRKMIKDLLERLFEEHKGSIVGGGLYNALNSELKTLDGGENMIQAYTQKVVHVFDTFYN